MNARFSLLAAAAFSILSLAPASAADLTWTYTPNKDSTGVQTIAGITITPTYSWKVDEYFKNDSGMLQIGKSGSNVVSIAYAFTTFPADIKSIAITGKTASSNSGKTTVSATIGTDTCSGSASLTSAEGTITLAPTEGTQSGNLSILISNPNASDDKNNKSSQAVYLRSIVVTYKDPNSAGLTQLGAPVVTPSNVDYFQFSFSWTGISGATGYDVAVKDANGALINTVTVNGTTATVTDLEEGATYKVSVVAKGDGTTTDNSEPATLTVTTATAPAVSAPVLTTTDVSSSAFTVSWPEQTSAASYSVCAWHFDFVDEFTEMFPDWFNNVKTLPSGWTRSGTALGRYATEASPIQFDASNQTLTSPVFPGNVTSLSFHLRQYNGNETSASTFAVYGSSGEDGAAWTPLRSIDLYSEVSSDRSGTDFSLSVPTDVHQFRFAYTKGAGNCGFGTFSVSGTDVCEVPFYLQGYGPTATSTTSTSVTLTPVAGEKNYVEVTAVGQTGKTASATIEVPVPAVASTKPVVIAVK